MKDSLICSLIGLAKFIITGLVTLLFRLITPILGLPNITPLMATELTGAKAYGPWIAGVYGATSMIALDVITSGIGPWTWNTAFWYGVIGILAGYFLKGRPSRAVDFVTASIAGTLIFDIATGIIPTLLDGRTALEAIALQAPFTMRHLAGNVFFALFAPWFYWVFMGNPNFELRAMRAPVNLIRCQYK